LLDKNKTLTGLMIRLPSEGVSIRDSRDEICRTGIWSRYQTTLAFAGFARHSQGNVIFSPSTFVMFWGGVMITADPEEN
jgi:hypothetical protein